MWRWDFPGNVWLPTSGADPGGSWGSKDPLSRIILEKPKEWYSGIKMHYFLSLASFQYFMKYNLPYLIWDCTHHAPTSIYTF